MNITKQTYQKYLDMGWSVIPWRLSKDSDGKISKAPAIPTWKEYQNRQATEEEISAWDGKYNAIAAITGRISGITVVDVDTEDQKSLNFRDLDSPMVVKSAFSGGKHYYYNYCKEARTTSKLDNTPVDIRSEGGLIILPPSNLGDKAYSFEKEGNVFGFTEIPGDVLAAIGTRNRELAEPVGNDLPEASGGTRNDTATRIAGSLFARIPFGLAEAAILPALREWNSTKCSPPLDEHELLTIFNSIKSTHAANHPEQIINSNDFGLPRKLNDIATERKREYVLELNAPRTGFQGLDKIIKGFIPGHVCTMTGETNVGKTSLCCNFAYNVAKNMGKVLYFALEPGNTIVDYLASVKEGKSFEESKDKIFDISDNIDVYTEGVNNVAMLKEIIDRLNHYDLIIIDHISYFITGSENYIQEQSNAIKALARIAKSKNTSILLVAHINKKSSQSGSVDFNSISGSAAFKQDSTEVMIVTRKDKEVFGEINVVKTKSGPNGVVAIRFYDGKALITEEGILNVQG